MQERFLELLDDAEKNIHLADHITYMTFPLVRDNRLLFKILEQLSSALLNIINSILQYEYLYKRIQLSRDQKKNLITFKEKCVPIYQISEKELQNVFEIFTLYKKHKQSGFEFVKNNKVIIMSDNLHTESITLEKIKEFLQISKDVFKKVSLKIRHGD